MKKLDIKKTSSLFIFIFEFLMLTGLSHGQETATIHYDYIDSNGALRGGVAEIEIEEYVGILGACQYNVSTIINNGPTEKRFQQNLHGV